MQAGASHTVGEAAWGRLSKCLRRFGEAVLDLCFPKRCAGCGKTWLSAAQGHWCRGCMPGLPWLDSPLCPQCGRPFVDSPTAPDHLCGECLLQTFPFDRARSGVLHTGVVRERVHQLKFGGQLYWVPPLVELLVLALQRQPPLPDADVILPVPLHKSRLRERGFNQSGLIAAGLAKRLQIPVRFDILLRSVQTRPQTRLNRRERLSNVKGAFRVVHPAAVAGRRVILLDDVFTTGTTLSECTRTLQAAGAAAVTALTVTRALPHRVGGAEQA